MLSLEDLIKGFREVLAIALLLVSHFHIGCGYLRRQFTDHDKYVHLLQTTQALIWNQK